MCPPTLALPLVNYTLDLYSYLPLEGAGEAPPASLVTPSFSSPWDQAAWYWQLPLPRPPLILYASPSPSPFHHRPFLLLLLLLLAKMQRVEPLNDRPASLLARRLLLRRGR